MTDLGDHGVQFFFFPLPLWRVVYEDETRVAHYSPGPDKRGREGGKAATLFHLLTNLEENSSDDEMSTL